MSRDQHRCAARACQVRVYRSRLMCPAHWALVPTPIKREIKAAFQERNNDPKAPVTQRYADALVAAVNAVASVENAQANAGVALDPETLAAHPDDTSNPVHYLYSVFSASDTPHPAPPIKDWYIGNAEPDLTDLDLLRDSAGNIRARENVENTPLNLRFRTETIDGLDYIIPKGEIGGSEDRNTTQDSSDHTLDTDLLAELKRIRDNAPFSDLCLGKPVDPPPDLKKYGAHLPPYEYEQIDWAPTPPDATNPIDIRLDLLNRSANALGVPADLIGTAKQPPKPFTEFGMFGVSEAFDWRKHMKAEFIILEETTPCHLHVERTQESNDKSHITCIMACEPCDIRYTQTFEIDSCDTCNGRGGTISGEKEGEPPLSGEVEFFETCDDCIANGLCPGCGNGTLTTGVYEAAMNDIATFTCEICGWHYEAERFYDDDEPDYDMDDYIAERDDPNFEGFPGTGDFYQE